MELKKDRKVTGKEGEKEGKLICGKRGGRHQEWGKETKEGRERRTE